MDNELNDIIIEAIEVFINHILYTRDVYPSQIFKKRKIYNTPVFASIYPPLNTYLYKVLRTIRELLRTGELEGVEVLLYKDDVEIYERYRFQIKPLTERTAGEDEFLMDMEEQLRASLYCLAERVKALDKLPSDCKFKVLIYTNQVGFVRLSHNPHYQFTGLSLASQ
ncbi:DNA polymerase zeta subunit 2 isoform X2 [Musca domestica]|uniref:Mitotic spindle assembly checkpoint protein MAD2B isoform X2 n=1 Tax=Musca domestica TaxID=7370 RepID=A0A1I8NDD1_MUSDO|nr:DNA polymerase zeta subunit 2 isoform X2 [Musca domestica]